jgi:NADP-dependent 3-hydroxy acid dehydrogenase YdfG
VARLHAIPVFKGFDLPKVVVVTGASAGVGRATVDEFARQGPEVALLARDPDRLERVATELHSSAHTAATVP